MSILSNKINKDELKLGDHIYSWRQAYIYAHHGIYIGDDKVIHFTRGEGQETGTGTVLGKMFSSSSPVNPTTPCPKCGDKSKSDGVILSCLDCFLSGGSLYLFHYSVSTAFYLAKARGGTCTMKPSDPAGAVLFRAQYLLDNGFGAYNVSTNNCEDFSVYCKTGLAFTGVGLGRSGQTASFLAAASSIVVPTIRFMLRGVPGMVVVDAGVMYCCSRYASDIGKRYGVERVPVERLVAVPSKVVIDGPLEIAKID